VLSLTALSISALPAAADGMIDWSCSCVSTSPELGACNMAASISGDVMFFGAFETGGEGPYSVTTDSTETVVTGDLKSYVTENPLKVVIVQPADGSDALVFMDERTPGGETFTAACEGTLPE
jgi:hypothetical protein